MSGKRVLLAAEFLRGAATLTRLLPLAVALAGRGHEVSLAVPAEMSGAIPKPRLAVINAPRYAIPPPPGFVARSYADLLMHGGYAAPDALVPLVAGWQAILDQVAPDLLITDFAPTAMLAGRLGARPIAAIGDGFSLPPRSAPMPDLRPWAASTTKAIDSVEGRVLAVINACLGRTQAPDLRHLRELFDKASIFLCTFPELDHYPHRTGEAWFGEIVPPSFGSVTPWPAGEGERVYVELDFRHPTLPIVIDALDRLGLTALVQAADMPVRQADALERRRIGVTATTNRASLLATCDLAICQTHEVAAQALLAGKPLLMAPVFVEQMMTLHRLASQGLGHGMDPSADAAAVDAAIRRLIDDRACRMRATNFARSYDGYQSKLAVDAIADEIDESLAA